MGGSKNKNSISSLIKVIENDEEPEQSEDRDEEEEVLTEEQVLEKAFEKFYQSAPKSNSPMKRQVEGGDSKVTFNCVTSHESDGESREVIVSPQ